MRIEQFFLVPNCAITLLSSGHLALWPSGRTDAVRELNRTRFNGVELQLEVAHGPRKSTPIHLLYLHLSPVFILPPYSPTFILAYLGNNSDG